MLFALLCRRGGCSSSSLLRRQVSTKLPLRLFPQQKISSLVVPAGSLSAVPLTSRTVLTGLLQKLTTRQKNKLVWTSSKGPRKGSRKETRCKIFRTNTSRKETARKQHRPGSASERQRHSRPIQGHQLLQAITGRLKFTLVLQRHSARST